MVLKWVRGQRSLAASFWRGLAPLILFLLLAAPITDAVAAKPRFSAIAVDVRTGKVLFSREADGLRHPASLTKVMTLYLLFEDLKAGKIKLDSRFKVSKAAAGRAPSKLGLRVGSTISAEDSIKALVTKSANDVASVIAENLSVTEPAFATRMTRKAHEIGMSRTVFRNASGLPDPRQVTTARDMATLSLRIQRDFPEYYPYFRTMSFKYAGRTIRTHNRLLGRFAGTDGIKTGYIRASGFNLTSSVKRGNKRIVGVVMGASSGSSRNAYMMKMLDKALPQCKDGTVLARAIEGTSPKSVEPEPTPKVAESKPKAAEEAPEQTEEPKQTALDTAPVPPPSKEEDESAVEEGGDDAQLEGRVLETVMAEAATSEGAPVADTAVTESVVGKTAPDGAPLPFAIKQPGDDAVGVVLVPAESPAVVAIPDVDITWHIQIGAYPSKKDAQAILYKVRRLDLDLLNDKQALTIEVQKGSEKLYRARFSGFSEKKARAACRRLSTQGFGCVAMQPQS